MIYNIFIGIAIALVASIFIIGFICIMLIASENDKEEYRPKNKKSTKKK